MKEYQDPKAYETIQIDIINNLSSYINKQPNEIKRIVVVGAYHGYEIDSFLNKYPESMIYAFEAYYKNFEVLKNRFKNNNRVICYNLAISDENGEAEFNELTCIGNGSLLKSTEVEILETIKVKTSRLDSILKLPIDLLWVDVQGVELKVLKGTHIEKVSSMFLEIAKRGVRVGTKDTYQGICYLDELEEYLNKTHTLHSIGVDNENMNGCGNGFWIRNDYGT